MMLAKSLEHYSNTRQILKLTSHIRDSHISTLTGELGESLFCAMLGDKWHAVKPSDCHCGDYWITDKTTGETLKVEIKTSKKSKAGRYNFSLKKSDKYGKTDYQDSDLLVMIAIDNAGNPFAYVIPTQALNVKKVCIPTHPTRYGGKYAKWLQRGKEVKPLAAIALFDLIKLDQKG